MNWGENSNKSLISIDHSKNNTKLKDYWNHSMDIEFILSAFKTILNIKYIPQPWILWAEFGEGNYTTGILEKFFEFCEAFFSIVSKTNWLDEPET